MSPKSPKSKQAAKTNASSNRKNSESVNEDYDYDQNAQRNLGYLGDGVVGADGGIEIQQPDLLMNKLDVQTVKHIKC